MEKIRGFFGSYRFLSNFWPSSVKYDFVEYPTVEHAYQAAKFLDLEARRLVRESDTPGQAKRLGSKFELRSDWEEYKIQVMFNLLMQKFTLHPELREQLLATKGYYLEETNTWNDTYWGVCNGKGGNVLGRMLMRIRDHKLS